MILSFPLVNHVAFHNTLHLPPHFKLYNPSKSVFTAYMLRSTNWPSVAPATFSPFPSTSTDTCNFPWHLYPCKRQAKKFIFPHSPEIPCSRISLTALDNDQPDVPIWGAQPPLHLAAFSHVPLSRSHWPVLHGQVDTRDKFFTLFHTPGAFGQITA